MKHIKEKEKKNSSVPACQQTAVSLYHYPIDVDIRKERFKCIFYRHPRGFRSELYSLFSTFQKGPFFEWGIKWCIRFPNANCYNNWSISNYTVKPTDSKYPFYCNILSKLVFVNFWTLDFSGMCVTQTDRLSVKRFHYLSFNVLLYI